MLNLETIHKPNTLEQALRLTFQPNTALLAGGTALLAQKRLEVRAAIDLSALDLSFIETRSNDIVIGATTTLATIVDSASLRETADGIVAQAAQQTHANILRNQASAVGTILSEPDGIFSVALSALDARLTIATLKDSRVENNDVSLADLCDAMHRHAQRATRLPHSIITEITIPASSRARRAKIETVARTPRDKAIVSVCAALELENGIVRAGAVALGGVAEIAWRARDAERELLHQGLTDEVIDRAAMAATSALNPARDPSLTLRTSFRGSAEYRTEMARVLTARALRSLRG
jgi:CO/xanthine dehydrogenase FAD-binding subunit